MAVSIKIKENWTDIPYTKNLIFVIKPGAGTFYNKKEYNTLEKNFRVVYFADTEVNTIIIHFIGRLIDL